MRRLGGRALIGALCGLITACAIIADPAAYREWNHRQFYDYKTFPNRPLCGVPDADPDCVAADPALDAPLAPPRAVASSRVLWNIDPDCRNRFPRRADGRAPSRAQVLTDCDATRSLDEQVRADENFISLSISGGGNRSAVFGTEAMFALDQWGLLDQVDAVSGVSGGSVPAALHAISCDPDDDGAYCDEARPGDALRWDYATISDRIERNLGTAFVLKRFSPDDIFRRFTTHRTTMDVLTEAIADEVMHHPNGERSIRFADLNPRRPNLIVNATNVTIDRKYLEAEARIEHPSKRLALIGERSHFAFTDYYFEKLLRSDLSNVPVSYAVAASAAFPVIIDMPTLARYSPLALAPDRPRIDFIHLSDASIHDNAGITEIEVILRGILNGSAEYRAAERPRRVVVLILDATLNEAIGVARSDPDPRNLESMIWPLRLLNTTTAIAVMLESTSGLRKDQLERFLRNQLPCGTESGRSTATDVECVRIMEIGVEDLDGHDSILVNGTFASCDDDRALAAATAEKQRECALVRRLKEPSMRKRLGLGDYHPQCYFEATRFAPVSYDPDPDAAICLKHAARWAVALKMMSLCTDPDLANEEGRHPLGIDCRMAFPPLPPLPECAYAAVVNDRHWTDVPRQTAHCACLEPGNCQPERLP